MNHKSMEPFGRALMDFFNKDASEDLIIHRDDGLDEVLPISSFFKEPPDFSPMEQTALYLCHGRILDVGAGVGSQSIALQNRGLIVCAIDIVPQACEIMRKRGVIDVRCADISSFEEEPFDTLLILGHGIGMVETLSGLNPFLSDMHRLVKPDGQILLNSLDIRYTKDPVHIAYQEANRRDGRYFGEIRLQFEYKGHRGLPYGWLHVDSETLAAHAMKVGWLCEVICQEESGDYLAQLVH